MTQINWTRNLVLAIALCALGAFAYWLEYKHKPEKETASETQKKIFALKDAQIESIRLDNGKASFQWQCLDLQAKTCKPGDNAKWDLTAPIQSRADDSSVNSLVSAINNIAPAETIDLKDETAEKRAALLKEYGLSPELLQNPSLRKIDVRSSSGESVLYFGGVNPINENFFAVVERVPSGQKPSGKIDDTRVYQIPSYFKSHFDRDLTYWRDKKLLSFAASEIRAFEIQSKKNGMIQAERKGDSWNLKTHGPKGTSDEFVGDIENMDTFLGAAAYLTAKNFAADSKSSPQGKKILQGLPELISIRFEKTGGSFVPIVLKLYGKEQPRSKSKAEGHSESADAQGSAIYATVSTADPLYELDPAAIKQLDREAKFFRQSKLITSLERFSIRSVEFSGKPMGDKPLKLVSKDTKWVNAEDQSEVNGEKVQSTFDRLSGNRIKDFLTGSAIPSGEQEGLRVILRDSLDEKTPAKRQLVFWKKDGSLFARDLNSSQKEAFVVDSSVAEGLPWNRNFYQK